MIYILIVQIKKEKNHELSQKSFFTLLYCMFNAHSAEQLSPQDWDNGTLIGAMQVLVQESERLHQMPSSDEVIEKINQAQALFTQYLEIYLNKGQLFIQKTGYFGAQSFAIGAVDNPNNPITPAEYTLLLTTLEYAANHNDWATAVNLEMACLQGKTMIDKRLYLHEIISALKKVPLPKGYFISSVARTAAIFGVSFAAGAAIARWYLYHNSNNLSTAQNTAVPLDSKTTTAESSTITPLHAATEQNIQPTTPNREEQIAAIERTNFVAPTNTSQTSENRSSIATDENGQSYGIVDLLPKRLQDVYRQSGGDMSAVYDAANGWEIAELTGKGLVAGTLAGGIAYGTVKAGKSLIGKYKGKDPIVSLEVGGSNNTGTVAKETIGSAAKDPILSLEANAGTVDPNTTIFRQQGVHPRTVDRIMGQQIWRGQGRGNPALDKATQSDIAENALKTAESAAARTGYQGANGNTAHNIDEARRPLLEFMKADEKAKSPNRYLEDIEIAEKAQKALTSGTRYINKIIERRQIIAELRQVLGNWKYNNNL